jgi:hypothetical protein
MSVWFGVRPIVACATDRVHRFAAARTVLTIKGPDPSN